MFREWLHAEQAEQCPGRQTEHRDRIVHYPGKADQRRGEPRRDHLGVEQRDRLGKQFAEDDVQYADQRERDRHRHGVIGDPGECCRQAGEQPLEDSRDGGLADPAEPEGGEGDPQLCRRDDAIEGLDAPERQPSFAIAVAGHLFQPALPGGNDGKLGRHEEGVREDQSEDNGESKTDRGRRNRGRHIPEG